MNNALLLLLLTVVVAGYIGTLIAHDPGYVLVVYDGYSMQTSLWVMFALMAVAMLLLYLTLRIVAALRRAPVSYRNRLVYQSTRRINQLTYKGHRLLAEGEYQRALKFLDLAGAVNEFSGLNYLLAACAADKLGDGEARESYLRRAEEIDSSLSRARNVLAAELALVRQQPEMALKLLDEIKPNDLILQIKKKAIRTISKRKNSAETFLAMFESDPSLALGIEKETAIIVLSGGTMSDGSRHELFHYLSAELKNDPAVIASYVQGLHKKDVVEPLLRNCLKKLWKPELVVLYGDLGKSSLQIRLKTAKKWHKTNAEDSSLQYCLGRIYEQSDERSLAIDFYQRSIDMGGSSEAARRLAEMMVEDGQYEQGVALYQSVVEELAK